MLFGDEDRTEIVEDIGDFLPGSPMEPTVPFMRIGRLPPKRKAQGASGEGAGVGGRPSNRSPGAAAAVIPDFQVEQNSIEVDVRAIDEEMANGKLASNAVMRRAMKAESNDLTEDPYDLDGHGIHSLGMSPDMPGRLQLGVALPTYTAHTSGRNTRSAAPSRSGAQSSALGSHPSPRPSDPASPQPQSVSSALPILGASSSVGSPASVSFLPPQRRVTGLGAAPLSSAADDSSAWASSQPALPTVSPPARRRYSSQATVALPVTPRARAPEPKVDARRSRSLAPPKPQAPSAAPQEFLTHSDWTSGYGMPAASFADELISTSSSQATATHTPASTMGNPTRRSPAERPLAHAVAVGKAGDTAGAGKRPDIHGDSPAGVPKGPATSSAPTPSAMAAVASMAKPTPPPAVAAPASQAHRTPSPRLPMASQRCGEHTTAATPARSPSSERAPSVRATPTAPAEPAGATSSAVRAAAAAAATVARRSHAPTTAPVGVHPPAPTAPARRAADSLAAAAPSRTVVLTATPQVRTASRTPAGPPASRPHASGATAMATRPGAGPRSNGTHPTPRAEKAPSPATAPSPRDTFTAHGGSRAHAMERPIPVSSADATATPAKSAESLRESEEPAGTPNNGKARRRSNAGNRRQSRIPSIVQL